MGEVRKQLCKLCMFMSLLRLFIKLILRFLAAKTMNECDNTCSQKR